MFSDEGEQLTLQQFWKCQCNSFRSRVAANRLEKAWLELSHVGWADRGPQVAKAAPVKAHWASPPVRPGTLGDPLASPSLHWGTQLSQVQRVSPPTWPMHRGDCVSRI